MVLERSLVLGTPMEVEPLEETTPAEPTPVEATPIEDARAKERYSDASPREEAYAEASPMEEASGEATPIEEDHKNESCTESVRDRRPQPVDNVVERPIGGKMFKLGRLLSLEEQ